MAVTLGRDLVLVVDTGTFDRPVLLLIPAPEAAGAVRPAEPGLVPDQAPDNRAEGYRGPGTGSHRADARALKSTGDLRSDGSISSLRSGVSCRF